MPNIVTLTDHENTLHIFGSEEQAARFKAETLNKMPSRLTESPSGTATPQASSPCNGRVAEISAGQELLEALRTGEGTPVTVMRMVDGYCNLSTLLTNAGKRWDNWIREEDVVNFLKMWPEKVPSQAPYHRVSNGPNNGRGIWAHHRFTTWAAARCHPKFGHAVSELVERYMLGRVTVGQSDTGNIPQVASAEMREAAAKQRRQTREQGCVFAALHSATFTIEDAAKEALPDQYHQMMEFLHTSGKMLNGSFHNMSTLIPAKLGIVPRTITNGTPCYSGKLKQLVVEQMKKAFETDQDY
ncbi:hypothetical protein WJX74_000121 [Apatococcus lobatus]|uniref:KilA-N domain-containing protein n=1 Tax=Apatococcus lobatus TaxID=904363 RepID=A0AAW1QZQ5_9CHLO